MKANISPVEALRMTDFVTAFRAASPAQCTLLCQQIGGAFPPDLAPTALWIVRVLGTPNTLAQVTELYGLCIASGLSTLITGIQMDDSALVSLLPE